VILLRGSIGKYIHRDSLLHKSNCTSKVILLIGITLGIFVTAHYLYFITTLITLCCLAISSRVSLVYYLRDIRSAWFFMLLAFLLQAIGGGFNLSSFVGATVTVLRIFTIVLASSIVLRSTRPTEIARFLENFLRFMRIDRQVARDFSTTIILALRFFPIMVDETDRIRTAQELRGVDLSNGRIVKRLFRVISIIIPVVLSAVNRAEQLAVAMETRKYGLFASTSDYYGNSFRFADVLIISLSIFLVGLAFWFKSIHWSRM